MQDIVLITPPSYHHEPDHYRLLILAAPEYQHVALDALRECWPDRGLSVYFVDKLTPDTAEWLVFHLPFVDHTILHITPELPTDFMILASHPRVMCTLEPGKIDDTLQMMLYHHASSYPQTGSLPITLKQLAQSV